MEELVQYFEMLLQYAENNAQNLNQASQQALAQLISMFQELIMQMSQQNQSPPIPPGPSVDQIEPGMPSSNVAGFAYDDKNQRLLVQFLGKHPDRNGSIYAYSGVPTQIFELFRQGAVPARTNGKNRWGRWWKGKVPSLGASLYTLLKTQNYPYQRLS